MKILWSALLHRATIIKLQLGIGPHCSCFCTVSSTLSNFQIVELLEFSMKLERGPIPNVMVALLNTGGAPCSTPQSLADAHY